MSEPTIVDRGDGPKIDGTRITVYTVLEYLRRGRTRDWIAATLNLSSKQVQAAINYISEHQSEVDAQYEKILERINKGNPPHVERQLRENREKVRAHLAKQQAAAD